MNQWPFLSTPWGNPPWVMQGSMVTSYFSIAVDDLRGEVHPDLLPKTERTIARARYYQIVADTELGEVAFNEAVLAFRTSWGSHEGEISYRMWTDSQSYLLWGREVFGWPLELADLPASQDFWRSGGEFAVKNEAFRGRFEPLSPLDSPLYAPTPSVWITPRRRLFMGGGAEEDTVLLVIPEVLDSGTVTACTMDFDTSPYWPSAQPLGSYLTSGFQLRVGEAEAIDVRSRFDSKHD